MILSVFSALVLVAAVHTGPVSKGPNRQAVVMAFIREHLNEDLKSCSGDVAPLPVAAEAELYEEEIDYIDVCDVQKAPVVLAHLKAAFLSAGCSSEHVEALEDKLERLHERHCSGQAACAEKIATTGMGCAEAFFQYLYQAVPTQTGLSDCEAEWAGCEDCLDRSLGACRAHVPDLREHLARATGLEGSVCDIVRGVANKYVK